MNQRGRIRQRHRKPFYTTPRDFITGGLTLFLFSIGMSIPFLIAAFAFERAVPKFTAARRVLQYSTTAAAAVMLIMGLLILSGNDAIVERLVPLVAS